MDRCVASPVWLIIVSGPRRLVVPRWRGRENGSVAGPASVDRGVRKLSSSGGGPRFVSSLGPSNCFGIFHSRSRHEGVGCSV